MNILTIILLSIIISPLTSLHTIFMLYDIKKEGIRNLSKEKKEEFKSKLIVGILFSPILIIVLNFCIKKINAPMTSMYIIVLLAPVLQLIYLIFTTEQSPFLKSKFRKISNIIFTILLLLVFLFFAKIIVLDERELLSQKIDVTNEIETFAKKDNLLIFKCEDLTFAQSSDNSSKVYFLDNELYHFDIYSNGKNKKIFVVNKKNLEKSYELTIKNIEIYQNDIYEKLDIDSIYNGINICDVCYLVNKNNVYKICAIFDKNSKSDDFYIQKFVLLDLKTGSISEFK